MNNTHDPRITTMHWKTILMGTPWCGTISDARLIWPIEKRVYFSSAEPIKKEQRTGEVAEANSGRGNKEELLRKPMIQQIQSELTAQVGDQWLRGPRCKMDCATTRFLQISWTPQHISAY